MKVLNVNMSLDPVSGGGTAERTIQISRQMALSGIDTTILTTDIGLSRDYKKNVDGVKIVALPCLVKRFYLPRFSYKLIKSLVSESDIVHLMGHWTFINALVYYAARQLKKPYVVCPAGTLPLYGRSQILKKIYNFIVGKNIVRHAEACIAVAVNEIDHFKAYGVSVDKISLIPNGINPADFNTGSEEAFRSKYKLGIHPFMLFVGRLNHIKGPDLLLLAFAQAQERLKGYHLVFAGPDIGMRAELERIIERFSLQEKVHLVGYLGGSDKISAYQATGLLVIPSRQEAMSIVVLEAGISGKPVLITDQCGFDDVALVNGGIMVAPSVEGIKGGLVEILQDPKKLNTMGKNLKKYVEDNFTWKIAVEKYSGLHRKILEGKQ